MLKLKQNQQILYEKLKQMLAKQDQDEHAKEQCRELLREINNQNQLFKVLE